jgi:hypothetical protein
MGVVVLVVMLMMITLIRWLLRIMTMMSQIFVQVCGYMLSDVMADALIVERSKLEPGMAVGSIQATGYMLRYFGNILGSTLGASPALWESDLQGGGAGGSFGHDDVEEDEDDDDDDDDDDAADDAEDDDDDGRYGAVQQGGVGLGPGHLADLLPERRLPRHLRLPLHVPPQRPLRGRGRQVRVDEYRHQTRYASGLVSSVSLLSPFDQDPRR